MSRLDNRSWLETEHFFNAKISNVLPETPYHDSKSQTRLSRFEIYDKTPVNYLDNVMFVDPITRQTLEYANQTPFGHNPQNNIALDPDTDQYCLNSKI